MFYHKLIKCFFHCLLFLSLISQRSLYAQHHAILHIAKVTGSRVNIRFTPNLNGEILGSLTHGTNVLVQKERKQWTKIVIPQTLSFWIHSHLLKTNENKSEGTVWKEVINIRLEPNVRSLSLGKVYKGQKILILEERFGWYRIQTPQSTFSAWISSDFIQKISTYKAYLKKLQLQKENKIYTKLEKTYLNDLLDATQNHSEGLSYQWSSLLKMYQDFIVQFPQSEHTKACQKKIVNLHRKLMEIEWKNVEKKLQTLPLNQSNRKKLIKQYTAFQKKFPKTPYSDTIEERIRSLSQSKVLKQLCSSSKVFCGFVEDLGLIFRRPARHKLIVGKKTLCLVRSKDIDLANYVSRFVEVRGQLIHQKGSKVPILEVSDIKIKPWKGQFQI